MRLQDLVRVQIVCVFNLRRSAATDHFITRPGKSAALRLTRAKKAPISSGPRGPASAGSRIVGRPGPMRSGRIPQFSYVLSPVPAGCPVHVFECLTGVKSFRHGAQTKRATGSPAAPDVPPPKWVVMSFRPLRICGDRRCRNDGRNRGARARPCRRRNGSRAASDRRPARSRISIPPARRCGGRWAPSAGPAR